MDSSLRSLRKKESTDSSIDLIWSRSLGMRLRCDVVLDEFGAQPHPGDRRAQVVADRGQHPGAVVDQGRDPFPHPVERLGDGADFFRPALGQRRRGAVQAETFGGLGE